MGREVKHRDLSLDCLCGILIINMIYRHLCAFTGAQISPYNPINIFSLNALFWYMPWFYFKSGMFFKSMPIITSLYKSSRSLLIPFLKFTLIGYGIYIIGELITGTPIHIIKDLNYSLSTLLYSGAIDIANPPLWFLISLFIARNLFNIITRITENRIILLVFTLTCGAWGIVAYVLKMNVPYYLINSVVGCFFFGMGVFLKELQYRRSWLLLALVIFIGIRILDFSFVDIRNNQLFMGHYHSWIIAALAGIILGNNLIKFIHWKKYNPFIHIGKYSMNFYVCHWFAIMIANIIGTHFTITTFGVNSTFTISILLSLILLPSSDYILRTKKLHKFSTTDFIHQN